VSWTVLGGWTETSRSIWSVIAFTVFFQSNDFSLARKRETDGTEKILGLGKTCLREEESKIEQNQSHGNFFGFLTQILTQRSRQRGRPRTEK
jgi:hypothetical protein